MGSNFNYVDYECVCPSCGAVLKRFQTKDGPGQMDTLKPWEVDNFYTQCFNCYNWTYIKTSEYARNIRDAALKQAREMVQLCELPEWYEVCEQEDRPEWMKKLTKSKN